MSTRSQPCHRLGVSSRAVRPVGARRRFRKPSLRRIRSAGASGKTQPVSPNQPGEPTTDFTPYVMMDYCSDPRYFCKHNEEVLVNATPEHCFHLWNKWDNLIDFLDLIGEILLDEPDENAAVMFCYYRFGKHPIMLNLHKTEIQESEFIKFESKMGMRLRGIVEFEVVVPGRTRVSLRFEHPMPTCLLAAKVGVFGVETHMKNILGQNLATFKMLAEGDLEFSDEKYDRERALHEEEEMRRAYERSGWVSVDEAYEPSDINDFAKSIGEHEVFSEGWD